MIAGIHVVYSYNVFLFYSGPSWAALLHSAIRAVLSNPRSPRTADMGGSSRTIDTTKAILEQLECMSESVSLGKNVVIGLPAKL